MDAILNFDKSKEVNFYQILGCTEAATNEQILAEYRAKAMLLHPDKATDSNDLSSTTAEFQKLVEARDVLSDSATRRLYDEYIHVGVAIPWKTWFKMSKTARGSVHFNDHVASVKNALTDQPNEPSLTIKPVAQKQGESDFDSISKQFRNYQI